MSEISFLENQDKSLFTNAPLGIGIADLGGRLLHANPAMATLLETTPETLKGKNFSEFTHPDDVGSNVDFFLKLQRGEYQSYFVEKRYITFSNNTIWVRLHVSPILNESGEMQAIFGFIDNITEVRREQSRFRDLVESINDWVWEVDAEGRYTYSSPRSRDLLGKEPDEMLGTTPFDYMLPEEAERVGKIFQEIVLGKNSFSYLLNKAVRSDGKIVHLETSGTPSFSPTGELTGYRGIDRDVTDRELYRQKLEEQQRELEETVELRTQELRRTNDELRRYLDIVDNYIITSTTDRKGRITHVSDAFCRISGYTRKELIGSDHSIVRHPEMPSETYHTLWKTIESGKTWEGEIKNRDKSGKAYWIYAHISPVWNQAGEISGYTAIREDITDKKRVEEISNKDELTGLWNRRYFNNNVTRILSDALEQKLKVSFAVFDVDYFKQYNDTYGHVKGDDVLQKISAILAKPESSTVSTTSFRLGGEEFGVILSAEKEEIMHMAVEIMKSQITDLSIPHKASPHGIVSISAGVCLYPGAQSQVDIDFLYRSADEALYRAKGNGRNRVEIKTSKDG